MEWGPTSGAEWSCCHSTHKHLNSISLFRHCSFTAALRLTQCHSSPPPSPFFISFTFSLQSFFPVELGIGVTTLWILILVFFSFFPFFLLNRQPSRSPGKVPLAPQRKPPSSMIDPRGQTTNQILAQERALRVLLRDGHRRSQTLKCSNVRRGGENRGNASRCLNVIA